MIDRSVEESLDLRGVEVDGDETVSTRGLEEIGHQSGGDGLSTAVLLVLAGIPVERRDHGNALSRGPLEGVDHDELLHDPGVDGSRMALHHKSVATADRLLEADEDLAIRELVGINRAQIGAEVRRHLLAEVGVSPPREEDESLTRGDGQLAHDDSSLVGGCTWSASAARADSVPGRLRCTHPGILRCCARPTAIAPAGTSSVITEPAAV